MAITRIDEHSPAPDAQAGARIAGFAYLATIASGLFAEVYARGAIRSSDATRTAENLRAFEELYRLGILGDGLMLVSYLVVTAMLYRLFKPVSPAGSLLAALFSMTGITMLAAAMAILLLPLQAGEMAAQDALRLHGGAFNLTGLFFGPYCGLIGWLVLRSNWLPALIGWLMVAAGAAFITDAAAEFVAPQLARRIPDAVMLISLVAEGSLALWLAAFGARRTARKAAA